MKTTDLINNKTLTENYLRKFNGLLEKHSSRLIDILESHHLDSESSDTQGPGDDSLISTSQHERQKKWNQWFVSTYALTHNVWDIRTDPIKIVWGSFLETSSCEELIASFPIEPEANPDVQKVVLVLVSLTEQLERLTNFGKENFVFQLILYGDGFDSNQNSYLSPSLPQSTSVTEGEGHVALSTFLPLLYRLKDFVTKVQYIVTHCFLQLEALFKDSRPHVVSVTGVNFPTMFHELGNLLSLIIIIDEIICSQPLLTEHWTKYKRMIYSVRADSANFDIDSDSLSSLEAELDELDRTVLGGRTFRNLLNHLTSQLRMHKRNTVFLEKFMMYFSIVETNLEQNFSNGSDEVRPIAYAGLFVLVSVLFSFDSRKMFRTRIWPMLKKIPAVPIGGNLIWSPDSFFNSFQMGNQINFLEPKLLDGQAQARHAFLESKIAYIQGNIAKYHLEAHSWTIHLQELMYRRDVGKLRREDLAKRSNCLLEGVKLAQKLSQNFRLVMNLHATLGRPVTVQNVSYLMQHLELLKLIQSSFYRFNVHICHTVRLIYQTALHIGLTNVNQVKESVLFSLNKFNRDSETRRDALGIISILENALNGPPSEMRLLIAKIAFDWFKGRCAGEEEEKREIIQAVLERLQSMVQLLKRIEELCNGASVYWHRQLFCTYFSSLYNSEMESSKFSFLYFVLEDCLQLLDKRSPHQRGNVQNAFLKEMGSYFQAHVLEKLSTDVENDLRLQTHSHLQMNNQVTDTSPFRAGVKDVRSLIELPSLVLGPRKTNIKFIVEYYLSKTFYNLASVALHDWQSYATMRVLTKDKHTLRVAEDHLPGHSLEQGQDILGIVRTLKKFVTEFSYNLNNQVFIQVNSQNKHLETVSIRHLANSMRTHGLGMSNNTVNCAYHFLRTKIHSFSQFLFDEQIKSKLVKDLRTFKQARQNQEMSIGTTGPALFAYPYDKAQKFQKGIRKLGLTPQNLSPLDQFRILITQIGNTLGFVRLVVSGGRHYLAQGTRFLADLDVNSHFSHILSSDSKTELGALERELQDAAENLNEGIGNLTSQKTPGIYYFHLLVSAFHPACVLPSNAHMKNFFVIIPALTLSYVDHIRSCKERLAKKSKSATIFSDDGFPMGLAYMLKVLDQDSDFDSLQWFSGVTHKLIEERKRALQVIQEAKSDEKLQQANTLTAKRVQDYLQEFHLLRYNLSSARIFFQQSLQIQQKSQK